MTASTLAVRLCEKYAFRKEISPELQERVLSSKKRTYAAITGRSLPEMSPAASPVKGKLLEIWSGRMNKKIIGAVASVCIIAAGAGIFYYSSKSVHRVTDSEGMVVFSVGDVSLSHADGKTEKVKPKGIISQGDTIHTGKSSFVTVQLQNIGNVKINENTVLVFSGIADRNNTILTVTRGSLYSKLKKIEKGSSYTVKTPVCVAAVRGTEFLTICDGSMSDIQVADGKVAVSASAEGSKEIIISKSEGVKVISSGMPKPRVLTDKERRELKKDSLYGFIADLQDKEEGDLDRLRESIVRMEKTIDSEPDTDNLSPLERLRSQGKPLTMVSLRDGSQLTGCVISASETEMKLDTGDGILTIPVKEVLRRIPVK